ncbi:MAG: hypothetical protein JNL28_08960 [Planctomycetes bacterium]|nr:hypothetical protein [Planctomycetota bacterium]
MKTRRKEGVLSLVILLGVVILAIFVSFAPGGDDSEGAGSVRSAKPAGRRALLVLLQKTGFDARAFDAAPKDLPRDRSILWLPAAPTNRMPTREESLTDRGNPERVGLHRLEYYRNFVESGGTLLLTAGDEATSFLVDNLGLEEAETAGADLSRASDVHKVRTHSGEELMLDPDVAGIFHALDPNGTARGIWSAEHRDAVRPFAVEFPTGAGSVVLLANDKFIRNDFIGQRDHALAAVRLIEELSHGGAVLFSEYEAGRWDPPSPLSLLFGPSLILAALHALLLLVVFVWIHAFVRGFPRDPEALALFSPYLRARSLSDTFERTRRFGTLAGLLRSGVMLRLEAIARARTRRLVTTETEVGAALTRVNQKTVSEFARAAGLTEIEPKLVELLVTRVVRTRADLNALDSELARLEREVEARMLGRRTTGK